MSDPYDQIVEIETTFYRRDVNLLLAGGYKLLTISTSSSWERSPCGNSTGMVRRLEFVLGRSSDIEHVELPPPPEPKRLKRSPAQESPRPAAASGSKPEKDAAADNGTKLGNGSGPLAKYRQRAK